MLSMESGSKGKQLMSRYRQTMSEALKKYMIDNDYLKSKMTPQQIANIKKTWQNKSFRCNSMLSKI